MTFEEFQNLAEVMKAEDVKTLLGIRSKRDWKNVRRANPQIEWRIPGMKRVRYLRREVVKLIKL